MIHLAPEEQTRDFGEEFSDHEIHLHHLTGPVAD